MATHYSASQLKSKLRQIEQKQQRAIRDLNREIDNYNRNVKRAINDYNATVRRHNANVTRNRQIIRNELRKLNTSSSAHSSYSVSSRVMQQHYENVGRVYFEGVSVTPEQDRVLDLIEQEQANSLITENFIEGNQTPENTLEEMLKVKENRKQKNSFELLNYVNQKL